MDLMQLQLVLVELQVVLELMEQLQVLIQ